MPDVATAPTATAAQTAAAGSRMIGFYLGAGGVKVDCLFDTANFVTKDAAGNVGIGTAAPGARLQVAGVGGSSVISLLETGVRNWAIRSGGAASNIFDIADLTAGATRLAITSTGRVGIGTTAPGANLHSVAADGSNLFAISGSSKGLRVTSDATSISITGVDNTLSGSFQPLTLGGSELRFGTASFGEVMRITAGGSIGIGTTAPGVKLHVKSGSGQIVTLESTNARGTGNSYLGIADATGRKAFFGYGASADNLHIMNEVAGQLGLGVNGVFRFIMDVSGNITPGSDNGQAFGSPSARWSVIYAATGTINTSDERFKIWIGRATEDRAAKDRRIARAILDELGWYQFADAVTEKGPDGARWHFGARAQRIWQIVADEGLAPPLVDVEGILLPDITWTGPVAPAWLCFDGWNAQFEDVYRDVVHVDEVHVGEEGTGEFGPDGAEIMRPVTEEVERIEREPTGERQLVRAAGHLFGFRVDEMNLLLSWALHDRLSALEAAA